MSIPRQIRTRGVEAVILFIQADPDYSALTGNGQRIFRQPYEGLRGVTMAPAPRQLHIYAGASFKAPGVGKGAWDREFEIIIEYYSQRDETAPALGALGVDDEIDELVSRLYVGEVAASPGRFEDPDNPGRYINVETIRASVSMPAVASGEAAVRRDISIILKTKESAAGKRPYET